MTVKIERKPVDNTTEHQITTAMIMSTKFLMEIEFLFNPDYMRNSFAKIVCFWCKDYFSQYKKAPEGHIKDIFLIESESGMSKEDKEIIGNFLSSLSSQFEKAPIINVDYLKDITFDYFRKRELQIRVELAQRFLEVGKIEDAEDQFSKYKKIAYQTSGWFNPLNPKEALEVFDDNDQGIFKLPGALGRIVGDIERDWFVAVLGVFKKGKSFYLQEMAVRAAFQGLKVAFISLEMKKKNIKERIYKRLTGFGSKTGEDSFLFPVFDCELNQLGTCERSERTQNIKLCESVEDKPEFDLDMEYRPCTYCRDNMLRDYQIATWYEVIESPQFTLRDTRRKIKAIETMYGDNFRFICYPRFMAGVSDIRRDLHILEQHEEFIPDIIIVDYADILKPDTKGDKRNQIDDIWKMLASLAAERHCIVFTASQGTRGAIYKSDMSQDDLAEWIGKLGHVDIFLGLNQSPKEKKAKVIRVNALVHRHKEVDENASALLLQQLEVGQFFLDSHMSKRRSE
jgi:replicative DNA helicase